MRAVWKGSLSFGLVNIPVEMHPAVRADERVHFRQLHGEDLSPIRYQRICETEGEEVPWSDIVKGYEYAKGKFVVLTEEDFKAAALQSSKTIEILDFVKSEEIDPRYFETPYYLLPQKGGERPYALLREAVRNGNMVGIGKLTMRSNSHHLAGIRVVDDALVVEIMRFERQLVDASDLTFPAAESVRPQELQMAEQLVANLAEPFNPSKYTDEYQDNLRKIINAKMKGKKIPFEETEEPEGTAVIDLIARLQESLEQGKRSAGSKRAGHARAKRSTGAAAAPTKSAAKRTRTRQTKSA